MDLQIKNKTDTYLLKTLHKIYIDNDYTIEDTLFLDNVNFLVSLNLYKEEFYKELKDSIQGKKNSLSIKTKNENEKENKIFYFLLGMIFTFILTNINFQNLFLFDNKHHA